MQDSGCELSRTSLPRTPVNSGSGAAGGSFSRAPGCGFGPRHSRAARLFADRDPLELSQVIQPMVYSHAVQLNGPVIFIAVLVGGMLIGILGALMATPVVEIGRIVVSDLVAYRRTKQEANEPAVSSPSQPST
jgi:hypothetical protein